MVNGNAGAGSFDRYEAGAERGLKTRVSRLSLRDPQARSNLMKVSRDCFAEFILSPAEGLAMTLGRTERPWTDDPDAGR